MAPILYAEDDEDDVFLMERAFKAAGVRNPLQTVPDGKSAIEFLSTAHRSRGLEELPMPCLLLLDLKMPGESGFDVIQWTRSQPATSSLPIVVVTSSDQESDIHRAYLLGANGYVVKPGKPEDLLVAVRGIRDYWLVPN
jgi:CheY-like chemotaxis protein